MKKFNTVAYTFRSGGKGIVVLWITGVVLAVAMLVTPAQVGRLTNLFAEGRQVTWHAVMWALGLIFASQAVVSVLDYVKNHRLVMLQEKLTRSLAMDLFSRLVRFAPGFFREREVESINTRVLDDSEAFVQFSAQLVTIVPISIISMTVFATYLILQNWFLGLMTIPLALLSGYFLLFDRQIQQLTREQREVWDGIRVRSNETVSGVGELRSHCAFDYGLREVRRGFDSYHALMIRLGRWRAFFQAASPLMNMVQVSVLYLLGALLCIQGSWLTGVAGQLTWGDVIQFMLVVGLFAKPATELAMFLLRWRMFRESMLRVRELAEYPITFDENQVPAEQSCEAPETCEVSFDAATVSTASGSRILRGVDAEIPAGQHVALVGSAGCGKSTLMNLVNRESAPSSGRAMLDGTDVTEVPILEIARRVGFSPQKPVLFDASIRNNILFSLRRPCPTEIADDHGYLDAAPLNASTMDDVDQALLEAIRDVNLEADVFRKALDATPPSATACPVMRDQIERLRQEIAGKLEAGNAGWLVPFRKDGWLPEGTLKENLLGPGGVLVEDDRSRRAFCSWLATQELLEDVLWLGLRRLVADRSLSVRVVQRAPQLIEHLARAQADGDVPAAARRSELLRLGDSPRWFLVDTALATDARLVEPLVENGDFVSQLLVARDVLYGGEEPFIGGCTWRDMSAMVAELTLRENLLLGRPDSQIHRASEHLDLILEKVLKGHGCYRETLLAGLEYRVGEQGKYLSGGQRQKVALARVLIKRPSMLLLDEATAALDEISQAKIVDVLRTQYANKTVVSISHRLSTIRDYDQILVMDRGQVIQQGSYNELLAQEGLFRSLALQKDGETLAEDQSDKVPPAAAEAAPSTVALDKWDGLRRCKLFADLSGDQFALLERTASEVHCPAGETLFWRGDEGDEFYIILEGSVEFSATRQDAGGAPTVVDTFGPGDAFGELALFGNCVRTLSARAKTALRLLVLQKEHFLELIGADPKIALRLLSALSRRIAEIRAEEFGPAST